MGRSDLTSDIHWDRELQLSWLARMLDLIDLVAEALPPDDGPLPPLDPDLPVQDRRCCELHRLLDRRRESSRCLPVDRRTMITLLQRIIALVGQEAPSSRRDYRLAEYHQEAADLLLELGEKPAAVAALRAALAVEPNVEVRLALEDERGRMERSESSEPTSEV